MVLKLCSAIASIALAGAYAWFRSSGGIRAEALHSAVRARTLSHLQTAIVDIVASALGLFLQALWGRATNPGQAAPVRTTTPRPAPGGLRLGEDAA